MTLANPWFLLFLLPLAFAAWRLLRRSRRTGIRFSALARLPAKTAGWRARVAALAPFVMIAGLALLVVAASRPRSPTARTGRNVDAIAIVMAVDISGSMSILDLAPPDVLRQIYELCRSGRRLSAETVARLKESDRLAVVKRVFAEFVKKRPDDLIGLVTFGTFAETRAPLTADHDALLEMLRKVEIPEINEETMTAIGDGLGMSLSRLEKAEPSSKVIVLLSDGVDNASAASPEAVAEIASRRGVKVYSIGVGIAAHFQPVVTQSMFGPRITTADATFDEGQLRNIAQKTGGRYFPVNDATALKEALEEIDRLETTPIETDAATHWNEHFAAFLLAGTLLALLAAMMSMISSRRLA